MQCPFSKKYLPKVPPSKRHRLENAKAHASAVRILARGKVRKQHASGGGVSTRIRRWDGGIAACTHAASVAAL